jgi:hypothetical protein
MNKKANPFNIFFIIFKFRVISTLILGVFENCRLLAKNLK